MNLKVIVLLTIVINQSTTIIAQNLNLLPRNLTSAKSPPRGDFMGNIVKLFDQFMTHAYRGRSAPKKEDCRTRMVKLVDYEIEISNNPVGFCSYCCPLLNPSQYVRLYFTNKSKAGRMEQLKLGKKLPGMLRSAGINDKLNTVIIIHGFSEHGLGPGPLTLRDVYLSREEDYNIFSVDWGDLCPLPWYPQAAQNTRFVAPVIAKFIKFYNDTGELPISKIHLVGFSLGAHIAGFIGRTFKGPQRISRITGLDPALPLFPLYDLSKRISKTDADYIDIIHTDGGRFGFPISVGHADFYPNGGTFIQPGCEVSSLAEQRYIQQFGICGHLRAYSLYEESVRNPKAFPATKCGIIYKGTLQECRFITEGYMGFGANKSTTGNFYLTTSKKSPFSKSAKQQEMDMKRINLILN